MKLPRNKRILFIAPHPDDEILCAGAFLLKLKDNANELFFLYVTSGSDTTLLNKRESEARRVCDHVGGSCQFLDIGKTQLSSRGIQIIADVILDIKPHIVFLPNEREVHPTHRSVAYTSSQALNIALFTGTIITYTIWNPLENPNLYFPFSEELMEGKSELLEIYSSQLAINTYSKAIKGLNRFYGTLYRELELKRWEPDYPIERMDHEIEFTNIAYAEAFRYQPELRGNGTLALGDIFFDILPLPVEREFQEGSTATNISFTVGGNAANFALALTSLGGCVGLYAKTGNDWRASLMRNILEKNHVRCYFKIDAGIDHENIDSDIQKNKKVLGYGKGISISDNKTSETAITFALSFKDGERHFFSDFGANSDFRAQDLPVLHSRFSHLHRAGFFWLPKLMGGPNQQVLKSAKRLGMTTSLDIGTPIATNGGKENWSQEIRNEINSLLPYVDVFFANEEEIIGAAKTAKSKMGAEELLKKGTGMVIAHEGRNGATAYKNSRSYHVDAEDIIPKNPTGAGDVFNAAFIFQFLNGESIEECLRFAVAAGTLHVKEPNNPYPLRKEIWNFMNSGI